MKNFALILPIALLWSLLHFGRQAPVDSNPLNKVLKKMDTAAAAFRTTQAEFEWDNYQKVIDEVDNVQTGTIYYRRTGNQIEMMADVKKEGSDLKSLKPAPKYVLFSQGKVRMYQPKPDQVTEVDLSKDRSVESYVVLGIGGSGQDLLKAFDVTYVGPDTVSGIATAKLQLVPKSEKVRNTYHRILLWIDLDKGISVQQQFFTPQEDYRLVKYSNIRVNEKISEEVFKLKTTSKTQTISPHG
jgi:outer membrane lipoprotein-sorting protein